MSAALKTEYETRYGEVLVSTASGLQRVIEGYLHGQPRIDRIAVRAKSPNSFLEKAQKCIDGARVYSDPIGQIQDQVGARVIVFYTSDVGPISDHLLRYCRHIEETTKEPPSEAEFGYFGKHFILAMPPDAVPSHVELSRAPNIFELQVRTLFQHAWSEAEHDLGYKPARALTPDQKREFAFTAAQAWGADLIFQRLHQELKVDLQHETPKVGSPTETQ
jgi:putative GTP pyrophosphokinase